MSVTPLPDNGDDAVGAEPDAAGYLVLVAAVDGHSGPPSEMKRRLLDDLASRARQLRRDLFAHVMLFTAQWMPHERDRGEAQQHPKYDVALVIVAPTIESAHWLSCDPAFITLHKAVSEAATSTHVFVTHNVRQNTFDLGPRFRRLYMLITPDAEETDGAVPGWGWARRRHIAFDLIFRPALWRYLRGRVPGNPPRARPVLYRLVRGKDRTLGK